MPLRVELTFGETADRAVAPLAMEFAVGDAWEEPRRAGGGVARGEAVAMSSDQYLVKVNK